MKMRKKQVETMKMKIKDTIRICTIYNSYMSKYGTKINEIQEELYFHKLISKPNPTDLFIVSAYSTDDDATVTLPRGICLQRFDDLDRVIIDKSALDEVLKLSFGLYERVYEKLENDETTTMFGNDILSDMINHFIRGIVVGIILEAIKYLDIIRQGLKLSTIESISFIDCREEILSILEIFDNDTEIYGL